MAQNKPTSSHFITNINTLMIISIFLLYPNQTQAESTAIAPSPSSSSSTPSSPWPIDIMAILKKGQQFTIFIKFLDTTNHLGTQINTQLLTSTSGVTVLAPTDSAFGNLPSGTLNKLSDQQKVQLINYHVLPKFYSLDDLETASNPVGTQATGSDGGHFWLNFTGHNNQVNVTTGMVKTPVSNPLRKNFPLAVYQIDKVLIPLEFSRKPHHPPPPKNATSGNKTAPGEIPKDTTPAANEPSPATTDVNVGTRMMVMMNELGIGLLVFCMGLIMF